MAEHTSEMLFGKRGLPSSTILNMAVIAGRSIYGGSPVKSSNTVQPRLLNIKKYIMRINHIKKSTDLY